MIVDVPPSVRNPRPTKSSSNATSSTTVTSGSNTASLFSTAYPSENRTRDQSRCCNPFSLDDRRDLVEQHDAELARDIAKDMNALTVGERARALDDVHGVAKMQEETPEFLQASLKALDSELSKLSIREKRALNRAFFLRPLLEQDTKFKLMFLRADEYKAEEAATRMARHFQQKAQLFGEEKLAQTITMKDLDEGDLSVLKAGHCFMLPLKDPIGRPIMVIDGSKADFRCMTSDKITRAFWYTAMGAVATDEIGQKKGVFVILYNSGNSLQLLAPDTIGKATVHTMRSGPIIGSLPFRYSSIHFCYDNPRLEFFLKTLRVVNSKTHRSRVMTHCGSDLENEYKLMTFGIQALNVLQSARLGPSIVLPEYLQSRVQIDEELRQEEAQRERDSGIIEYPKPQDVLIGRGAPHREFPGTVVWDKLILKHLSRYIQSSNFEKTCLSMDMVKLIQESNGRFLQRTNSGWKVLDDSVAREKAAIAFRSRAKAASLQQQQQHSDDKTATTATAKRLRVS